MNNRAWVKTRRVFLSEMFTSFRRSPFLSEGSFRVKK